jgi:hypothetical protein
MTGVSNFALTFKRAMKRVYDAEEVDDSRADLLLGPAETLKVALTHNFTGAKGVADGLLDAEVRGAERATETVPRLALGASARGGSHARECCLSIPLPRRASIRGVTPLIREQITRDGAAWRTQHNRTTTLMAGSWF